MGQRIMTKIVQSMLYHFSSFKFINILCATFADFMNGPRTQNARHLIHHKVEIFIEEKSKECKFSPNAIQHLEFPGYNPVININ